MCLSIHTQLSNPSHYTKYRAMASELLYKQQNSEPLLPLEVILIKYIYGCSCIELKWSDVHDRPSKVIHVHKKPRAQSTLRQVLNISHS